MFAVHPYGKLAVDVMNRVRYARRALNAGGAGTRPIWITEAGWASGPTFNVRRFTVPEATQARYLSDLYGQALAARGTLKLAGLIWFSYRDTSPAPGGSFYWGFRTGLHRESGMPKPAWTAFSRFARSAR